MINAIHGVIIVCIVCIVWYCVRSEDSLISVAFITNIIIGSIKVRVISLDSMACMVWYKGNITLDDNF